MCSIIYWCKRSHDPVTDEILEVFIGKISHMAVSTEVVEYLKSVGVGRRNSDDPFFSDKPPPRLGVYDLDEENHEVWSPAASDECRYTCGECRRPLPSPHLLALHLQEEHDSFFAVAAAARASYSCYIEECKEKFLNAEERMDHCVKVHKWPKDFRFNQKAAKKSRTNEIKPKNTGDVMDTENSSSSGPPPGAKTSLNLAQGAKMPRNFSFGHNKNKGFPHYQGKRFTDGSTVQRDVDMDVIVSDLKESLPE